MKEVTRSRHYGTTVTIKQGMNTVRLAFEYDAEYDRFSEAFNCAFGIGECAVMEAEKHHFEAPLSALPEEE